MKNTLKHILTVSAGVILPALLALAGFSSCDFVYDDLGPCPHGLRVRFVYDYNLDETNTFAGQVDCVTLHIYDEEGKYVTTFTETTDVLKEENYRMTLDLPEGKYRLIAYGGMECEEASFLHSQKPTEGSLDTETGVAIHPDCLVKGHEKARLHDLFYGSLNVEVNHPTDYTDCTVEMIKDTNHFRILLQNLNGEPMDGNDFEFRITDDNTIFDHNNDLIPNGEVDYHAWVKGSVGTGTVDSRTKGITEINLAYAELSTSRLMTKNSPKLIVTNKETGEDVITLPINNYLLALRAEKHKKFGNQEFLDRGSEWKMLFFMSDDHTWYKAVVRVNDWDVRVNEIQGEM